jgi:hypothetical protein
MRDEQVTIGEVYRLCQRIDAKVDLQNGRVRKLEDDALRIKTFWAFGAVAGGLGLDWLKHKLGF